MILTHWYQKYIKLLYDPGPPAFRKFSKIPRLTNTIMTITEKLDGTNAVIYVDAENKKIYAGSRNQWLTVEKDNFGFAKWVKENEEALLELGPGYHYGEWIGSKINRGYGLKEKRLYLFNPDRYDIEFWGRVSRYNGLVEGLHKVPILYQGPIYPTAIEDSWNKLYLEGSKAVRDYGRPEGIVIDLTPGGRYKKYIFEKDVNE